MNDKGMMMKRIVFIALVIAMLVFFIFFTKNIRGFMMDILRGIF